MKSANRFWIINLFALLCIVLLVAGSCSDDKGTNTKEDPLDLPPLSSLVMDFNDFVTPGGLPHSDGEAEALAARVNWGQSAFRVGIWNAIIFLYGAVPVAAFVESFKHTPVRQTDSSWTWSYSVTVGVVHTCRLNGKVVGDEVQWNMYITKEGEDSDYLWFFGSHNLPATEGSWTLNRHPDLTNPFIEIDWHVDPSTGTGDLKYTNVIPGGAENGGYIFYGSTVGTDHNRFYNIYNKGLDNLAEIEWHHTLKYGHVRDENFYGDTLWRCWGVDLEDVDCD